MEFNDELKALVDEVASRVDRWIGQSAWTFEPGSSAAAETANTELRQDGAPWGTVQSARRTSTRRWQRSWRWRCPGAPRC